MAATPADRAATHAYLIAIASEQEAELANLPHSTAAMEALATRVSGECSGVLAGAPPPEGEVHAVGLATRTPTSARVEAERQRESRQSAVLKLELGIALADALHEDDREPVEALIGALAPLKWSRPAIGLSLHLVIKSLEEEFSIAVPEVCVDMRSWVASGYKTLSPAAKAFAHRAEALIKHAFELVALYSSSQVKPFPQVLVPYEDTADRALADHIQALAIQLRNVRKVQEDTLTRLEAAVGFRVMKREPPIKRSIRKPAAVGRGRTAAGGRFVVRAEPLSHSSGPLPSRLHCTVDLTIEEPSRPGNEGVLSILAGEGSGRCLSRFHITPEQKVSCNAGLLTIEAGLPPSVRSVRLLLSDNRTITSPAVQIPARLGGPVGFYYQVVRGPSPIPVSATELDGHGHTVTVLKLPRIVECSKRLRRYFPGGVVRLAHESLPQGPTFTIRGERYRELGQVHFELKLEEDSSEELFGGANGGGSIEQRLEEGARSLGRQVFEAHGSQGCQPHPYAIVYGLLKDPRDTVLARVSGKLIPLRNVAIPARLHAGGVLAYGVFSPLPTKLLTRDARGKTLAVENLGQAAQADTETCEGEAES